MEPYLSTTVGLQLIFGDRLFYSSSKLIDQFSMNLSFSFLKPFELMAIALSSVNEFNQVNYVLCDEIYFFSSASNQLLRMVFLNPNLLCEGYIFSCFLSIQHTTFPIFFCYVNFHSWWLSG
uniref:Uncharacterized protein n=1 Tax=Micrurus paraensis TaxID=1970185 RepID=A0A2D4KCW7_9SAUR